MLLLFGIICALLSGCCLSSTIVFTGRIKHVLLTHAPKTELFRMRTYEQVYILASVTAFAIVANFCMVSYAWWDRHMFKNIADSAEWRTAPTSGNPLLIIPLWQWCSLLMFLILIARHCDYEGKFRLVLELLR